MTRLFLMCAASILWSVSAISAQNDTMPAEPKQGVTFKKLFFNYTAPYSGEVMDFRQYGDGFEIGYVRKIGEQFELYIPIRSGVAHFTDSISNNNIFGVGAQGQYFFKNNQSAFQPYAVLGLNATLESERGFHADIPVGIGLDAFLAPSLCLNIQGNYNFGLSSAERSSVNLSVGFKHYFGSEGATKEKLPADSDGDGIPDDMDECPEEKGPKETMGCPDTDGDGIPDAKDRCPQFKGVEAFDGCPDSDGDGISDNDDECPNQVGPRSNDGCPEIDRDEDGILDKDDKCPDQAGPATTDGCPDSDGDGVINTDDRCPDQAGLPSNDGCPDSDGDGVVDIDDLCPGAKGPAANRGCPQIEEKEQEVLDLAMEAVQFETGKSTLRNSSFEILNQIVQILKKYPGYKVRISGHTDNVGSAQLNQTLSEQRARSCYEYLASRGISTSRMSYIGYGESKPRASNATIAGQKLNRRVEFDLYLTD